MPNYALVPIDGDRVYAFTFEWDLPPVWWNPGAEPSPRSPKFEPAWQSVLINPSTPVLEVSGTGKGLYVGSVDGSIYKLDFGGEVVTKWSDGIQGEVRGLDSTNGVLCFAAGGTLHGLDLITGKMWSHVVGVGGVPAPAAGDGKIYSAGSGGLHAFNTDGTTAWPSPFPPNDLAEGDRVDRIRAKPGRVYFTTFFNEVTALTAGGEHIWSALSSTGGTNIKNFVVAGTTLYAIGYLNLKPYVLGYEYDASWMIQIAEEGAVAWGPAYVNGKVIVVTGGSSPGDDQFVYALPPFSYDENKIVKSTVSVASAGKNVSDPAGACERVFVTSQDGHFYALSDSTLELVWKATIPQAGADFFSPSLRPTIVCGKYPTGPEIDPAVDLLALVLPGDIYAKITKYDPQPPTPLLQGYLRAAMSRMTPEQRREALMRSRALGAKAKEFEAVFADQQ